jgi:hypothetical protein
LVNKTDFDSSKKWQSSHVLFPLGGQFFAEGLGFPVVDEVLLALVEGEYAAESGRVHTNL